MLELMTNIERAEYITYQNAIADAYYRMSTNRDKAYREEQMKKVELWAEKMTRRMEQALKRQGQKTFLDSDSNGIG